MTLQTSPSPLVRRAVGLAMALAAGWMTNLSWVQARRDGEFGMAAALMGPAFCVIGLGLVLFKGYRQERLERGEDISRLQGMDLLTPRWKGVLAAALAAMAVNYALLNGWV
ncbi:MAG: hypothetical protein SF070_04980 [Gemmatimonadota bacterium]|nr:hypothetical protein [Gemmatimonadota bacterium]